MKIPKVPSEAHVRAWARPYLDQSLDSDESLLVGVACGVHSLVQDGTLKQWPGTATMVLTTEYQILVASAEWIQPIPWFLVTDWGLTGNRLLIRWFAPRFDNINSFDIELDAKALKKQQGFEPLLHRLFELTEECVTPSQREMRVDALDLLRARQVREITFAEHDNRVRALLAKHATPAGA